MVGQLLTVPPPSDDDHEDVAWALRAASAQWRRDERRDAVAWVRRAAETAIEVGQAIRARELFILAQRLEQGPAESGPGFDDFGTSVPPSLPAPPARLAVAPPMRAPAVVVPAVAADVTDLEFEDSDSVESVGVDSVDIDSVGAESARVDLESVDVEDEGEIVFDDEVEQLVPSQLGALSIRPTSGRGPQSLPSAFPSSVPAQAMPPSIDPLARGDVPASRSFSYPTSTPPNPWSARESSEPPGSRGQPALRQQSSLPPLPSLPSPRGGSSAPPSSRASGGFDTAFLDSLDEPLPSFSDQGDVEFGEEPPTRQVPAPSAMVDLPARARVASSSLPIDRTTAAEYAQRTGRRLETPEDIEHELGVDLSVGSTRPPPPDFRMPPDLSPTPGRASVRPSTRPSGTPTVPSSSRGIEPFALAPSASLPPVRFEPASKPTQAPPPESMSEPEPHDSSAPDPEFDIAGQVHPDRSSTLPGSVPPPGGGVSSRSAPSSSESLPPGALVTPAPGSLLPPIDDDDDDVLAGAFERLQSRPPPVAEVKPAAAPVVVVPAPASMRPAAPAPDQLDGVALLEVKGLQDLPEDAMDELIRLARIVPLAPGEEVASFGVALVTAGSVQLMPTVADASCARAGRGEVVFTRGTVPSSVVLRVVGAEPGTRVAVLSDADLDAVTSSCPWVRDELAEVGDRFNAFGGAVLGPLGESLDEMFRAMVLEKCTVKNPAPGSMLAFRKKPMDGLYVLGAGSLLILAEDGKVESELSPGDFVFPETVLGGSPARADVRVAKGGALLLYADRKSAHELLATCPPFIEILAS